MFLSDPIPFPGGVKPSQAQAAEPAPVYLGVGDKIKKIAPQADGSKYRDGVVIEVNGQYAKVRARRAWSPWHNCMREVWVKGSDCEVKRNTRMPRKAK